LQAKQSLSATAKFTLKNCAVPNLEGKTLAGAKRALKEHFCRAGKVRHAFSGTVQKGHVISQRPKRGTQLKHGGKVGFTVSKGPKP
jgi:serine/threonine-protein kinase